METIFDTPYQTNYRVIPYLTVLVDGRYEDDKRDLTLAFRGSSNQRIWRKVKGEWVADNIK